MRRRHFLWSLAALALVGSIAAVFLARPPQPRITEAQYEMIRVGMTLEEVEGVLGCQAGNYAPRKDFLPIDIGTYGNGQLKNRAFEEWAADTDDPPYADANGPHRQEAISIRVWFDDRGRVIDKYRMGISYSPPSLVDKVRKWLRQATGYIL